MPYAAFFKTHKWNDLIERQYDRFKRNVILGDLYILFDNTNGGLESVPKKYRQNLISISNNDIGFLGLPECGSFWFNGDYASIISLFKKPYYEYYCFLEYDVYSKNNIDSIIKYMKIDGVDIVGEEIKTHNYQWPHISSCKNYYKNLDEIKKSLFCVGFFSRRALAAFYMRRLEQREICDRLNLDYVPIGEAVMATEAKLSGLKYENLNRFCKSLEYYDWNNGCTEEMVEEVGGEDTFVHPVYDYEKFVRSNFLMGRDRIDEKLIRKLHYVRDVNVFSRAYYLQNNSEEEKAVIFKIFKNNMSNIYDYLKEDIISYGKKATQSSFCKYSISKDESSRALNLVPRNTYSFHTNEEDNPWWMLDFEEEVNARNIYLFDRPDISGFRSKNLQVLVGKTLQEMEVVFENKTTEILFNVKIGVNNLIRYVKVVVDGRSMLHIDTLIVTR
ncbi:hypothetical protein ACLRDC_07500 [Gluconacetobacter sacchari]|uniref:hypothetical protein n=1 Tax=Gluconacetobacter sacchari TaxID=92759 RepID=UPI0039B3BABD